MTKINFYQTTCGIAALLLCLSAIARGQAPVISLYSGVAPGSEDAKQKEVAFVNPDKQTRIRNVTQPTLTAFLPERAKATGTAIVIAPGGGFQHLAIEKEGYDVARWLQSRGVAAFVLKYRLMDTGTEEEYKKRQAAPARPAQPTTATTAPTENPERQRVIAQSIVDGRQALKLVRQRAAEWGIATDRIGLMGFSAGGILTMGVVMQHDAESRPNFAAPIYGGGTNGLPVAADAPPLFIAVADDDQMFSASSAKLYLEWKAAKRPAELHIYSKGGHGFGLTNRGWPVDSWIDRFGDWLQTQGLLKAPAAQ
ncbi:MAG: alpha/beta hydrolase [Acidobacteria bacterium]|nr:alpha/beta hydrolase [Acidobacteriota bacterium]